MKLKAGLVILPFDHPDHGTVGVRVQYDDGIDHRRLRRVCTAIFKANTGRHLPKRLLESVLLPWDRL